MHKIERVIKKIDDLKQYNVSFCLITYALDLKNVVSFDKGHKKPTPYLEISLFNLSNYKYIRPEVE